MQSDLGVSEIVHVSSQDLCYAIATNSTLIPTLHPLLELSKHYLP